MFSNEREALSALLFDESQSKYLIVETRQNNIKDGANEVTVERVLTAEFVIFNREAEGGNLHLSAAISVQVDAKCKKRGNLNFLEANFDRYFFIIYSYRSLVRDCGSIS